MPDRYWSSDMGAELFDPRIAFAALGRIMLGVYFIEDLDLGQRRDLSSLLLILSVSSLLLILSVSSLLLISSGVRGAWPGWLRRRRWLR
jgi:hypothetical protein